MCRPNPRHVRDWVKSQGRRAKTDRQDALLLARDLGAGRMVLCILNTHTDALQAAIGATVGGEQAGASGGIGCALGRDDEDAAL